MILPLAYSHTWPTASGRCGRGVSATSTTRWMRGCMSGGRGKDAVVGEVQVAASSWHLNPLPPSYRPPPPSAHTRTWSLLLST